MEGIAFRRLWVQFSTHLLVLNSQNSVTADLWVHSPHCFTPPPPNQKLGTNTLQTFICQAESSHGTYFGDMLSL
jgi:hypothetical protein